MSAGRTSRIVAGIMSGTSLDGIDCVMMRIRRKNDNLAWKLLSHVHIAFPPYLAATLKRNSHPETSKIDEINDLNQALSYHYAGAVSRAARKAGIPSAKVDLIGCHGQTMYHRPVRGKHYGKRFGATLQIGDPSTLSALTGCTVVGNFRSADLALGGEGAPLVPYVDYVLFRSEKKNRLVLNIGGIANFTFLPARGAIGDTIAFDTGPGNMVVDSLMQKFYRKPFDRNGAVALGGRVNEELFMELIEHPYLHRKPPKSTGREEFGSGFIEKLLRKIPPRCSRKDVIATVSEFTAWSIFHAYIRYVNTGDILDELIVSGGGALNRYFRRALADYFEGTEVYTSDRIGLPVDAKEAVCFAVLANETVDGIPSNMPSVTGSRKRIPLGVIARNF